MKALRILLALTLAASAFAAPPAIINHQGRIAVANVNHDGPGYFKFALVDAGATETFWTNDGTSTGTPGAEPTDAVTLAVSKGHYALGLGDTTLTHMTAVPTNVFNDQDDVHLRIWFSTDNTNFNLLTPDRRIASAAYALSAEQAQVVPDGAITAAMLAAGSVTTDALAAGAVGANQLAPQAAAQNLSADGTIELTDGRLVGIGTNTPAAGLHLASGGIVRLAELIDNQDGFDRLNAPRFVTISGTTAYVASFENDALSIIDVTDPANPVLLSEVVNNGPLGGTLLDGVNSVDIAEIGGEQIAFVTAGISDSLTIINVTIPTAPVLLAQIAGGVTSGVTAMDNPTSVTVSGTTAYVAAYNDGSLTIIDVSDPQNPSVEATLIDGVGGFDALAGARMVTVSGTTAYVASDTDDSLTAINVATPGSPSLIKVLQDGVDGFELNGASSVRISGDGNTAYVTADNSDALNIIDVTDINNGTVPPMPTLHAIAKNGDGSFNLLEGARGLAISGDLAYVASTTDDSLTIIDVSDPASPILLVEVQDGNRGLEELDGSYSVAVAGTICFVTSVNDHSLTILDFDRNRPGLIVDDRVGIGTDTPQSELDVNGTITATAFSGSGADLMFSTTDTSALEFKVNNNRALRLQPGLANGTGVPNLIGGSFDNFIDPASEGSVIGGGGTSAEINSINADFATISGGLSNLANGEHSTIGGGRLNQATGGRSTVGGGGVNQATGALSTVAGGLRNEAAGNFSTVGGGVDNTVGRGTDDLGSGGRATVGGGEFNQAIEKWSTIGGGESNQATAEHSTIGGGEGNQATDQWSAIGGGQVNKATGVRSTVAGGLRNEATGGLATVGGGGDNIGSGVGSTVGGGGLNQATGDRSTVPGGLSNIAGGDYSFAAGRRAKADHVGAFVWGDSTDSDFSSTAANQFLIRAGGGVGIGTTAPATALDVNGTVTATGFSGPITAANIPPGTVIAGQTVTGATQVALANTNYLTTGTEPAVFDLPDTANVGDVIEIAGAGTGGWATSNAAIDSHWTARDTNRNWESIASSADGSRLVACTSGTAGRIYVSSDWGRSWTARGGSHDYRAVASSSTGENLIAVPRYGQPSISTDFGATWSDQGPNRYWNAVASSADGQRLVAVGAYFDFFNGSEYSTYTSTNGGVNWTARTSQGNAFWNSVAMTANGTTIAMVGANSKILISTNTGGSWVERDSVRSWSGVTCSADGTRMVATVTGGKIYTSGNSGATWSPQDSDRNWGGVASSSDGSRLIASTTDGNVYLSTDFGSNWMVEPVSTQPYQSVATSADGTRLAAVVTDGQIHVRGGFSGNGTEQATYVFGSNGQWSEIRNGSGVGDGTITTANLIPGAITSETIADGAVTSAAIADGSVMSAAIADGAITSAAIADGTVSVSNLSSDIGVWSTDGTDVHRVSGKVGIGTLTPSDTLTVHTPGNGYSIRNSNDDGVILNTYLAGSAQFGTSSNHNLEFFSGNTATVHVTLDVNGNLGIGDRNPDEALTVAGNVKCTTAIITSDRNKKDGFKEVDPREILAKVAAMPITRWHYKTDADVPHIGPVAQDFHAAFGLGSDNLHIATVDADGIALAAIQGLSQIVEEKDSEIDALKEKVAAMEARFTALEKHLGASN